MRVKSVATHVVVIFSAVIAASIAWAAFLVSRHDAANARLQNTVSIEQARTRLSNMPSAEQLFDKGCFDARTIQIRLLGAGCFTDTAIALLLPLDPDSKATATLSGQYHSGFVLHGDFTAHASIPLTPQQGASLRGAIPAMTAGISPVLPPSGIDISPGTPRAFEGCVDGRYIAAFRQEEDEKMDALFDRTMSVLSIKQAIDPAVEGKMGCL